ncbi:MAG: XRE family transcriptional regulator [Bacteroidota bacterium]
MTKLGLYLTKNSFNRSDIARKIGVSKYRMHQLTHNEKSKILAVELYLIAQVVRLEPNELFLEIFGDLKPLDN